MPAPKPMRKIIVGADDFRVSAEVNRAIVEAFENNVTSSTTLMANMPGFDEACELAHRHRFGEQNRPASEPDLRISIIISHSTMRPVLRYQWDVSRSANSVQVV
jgi:hypothetical protein